MARIRSIKPGFFENEELAQLPPLARLLFAGLWCWADREGRLEDRPARLKTQVLAYDDCDLDDLLDQLANSPSRFIVRYEVEGAKYIAINNFDKHQLPHVREVQSLIPAPTKAVRSRGKAGSKHNLGSAKHNLGSAKHNLGDAKAQPRSLGSRSGVLDPGAGAVNGNGSSLGDKSPGESKPPKRFTPPTPEEVEAYCKSRNNGITGATFCDWYQTRNWCHSKGIRMSDWKAAVRTWEKNPNNHKPSNKPRPFEPCDT